MDDERNNILVWLPSPIGDAVLCTPALRALRHHFKTSRITFLAGPAVRQVLEPCTFNDTWLESHSSNPLAAAPPLRTLGFSHAVLFKNSFASALTAFLAAIPSRIGYARDARTCLLTERLHPQRLPRGGFKPLPMIDYYLAIVSWMGCDTSDRTLELRVNPNSSQSLASRMPDIFERPGPLIVMVPGGAFGPSKYWPTSNFAETADRLISKYNATIVVSVAANPAEHRIATEISKLSRHELINLAERPISLGELKALFSNADLVISNDTGPRHIAIALGRNLITLFGPNDPAWTDSACRREIKIIGRAPCAPCARPKCPKAQHLCMQAITVEMVCDAANKLLCESQDNQDNTK